MRHDKERREVEAERGSEETGKEAAVETFACAHAAQSMGDGGTELGVESAGGGGSAWGGKQSGVSLRYMEAISQSAVVLCCWWQEDDIIKVRIAPIER